MKLKSPSAYWSELDEKRRSEYRIVAAVLLGIFTLFTAIAVGSYLFTWKQDASLLSEPSLIDSDVEVHNASSKLGFRWGHFLVTRSFGLAALGLVAFFVAWTLSRFIPKMRISLGKWFVYSFTGTFIGSWLLALVSRLAGWDTLFGGGLGGRAGAALVDGSINLVGYVVTAIAVLALAGMLTPLLVMQGLRNGLMNTLRDDERIEALGSGLSVLISPDHGFGTDALLLAEFADPKRNALCMDLGTGCGIIPMLWKRNGVTADLYGLELQEKGYDQFRRSIDLCAEQGVPMENVHALCGDLRDLSSLELPLGKFKTVTMNPPYKPVDTGILSETTAEQIARHETTCTMDDAAAAAERLLNFGGNFAVCHRPERLPDVLEAFRAHSIEPKRLRFVQKNAGASPWLFLLEGRKGGKPFLKVLPPLLMQNEDGSDSDELLCILGDYRND